MFDEQNVLYNDQPAIKKANLNFLLLFKLDLVYGFHFKTHFRKERLSPLNLRSAPAEQSDGVCD